MRRLGALLALAALAVVVGRLRRTRPGQPGGAAPGRAAGASPYRSRPPDPQPVVLPGDDAPHDRLTEWWYDTGHLRAADGRRFGFELRRVPRRARRLPGVVGLAPRADRRDRRGVPLRAAERDRAAGRPLAAGRRHRHASSRSRSTGTTGSTPWSMAGWRRHGRPAARWRRATRSAATRWRPSGSTCTWPPASRAVLHDGDGWIDFGPAGGSYYYSRTDMAATGTVTLGDETLAVEGDAWFDHQWGDFISVGGGGWDWFAVNLDDGTDLTLSLVRVGRRHVSAGLRDARRRRRARRATSTRDAFTVDVTDRWTSPSTGATYPAGWRSRCPARASRSTSDRPSPSRSSTRGRRPASCTGRAPRS